MLSRRSLIVVALAGSALTAVIPLRSRTRRPSAYRRRPTTQSSGASRPSIPMPVP